MILTSAIALLGGCSSTGKGGKGSISDSDLGSSFDSRLGSGSIPTAEGEGLFRDVRFDYDSSEISDEGMQNIEYNVEILRQNPSISLILEGHCDERGTAEYNIALGNQRARAVERVLRTQGIQVDRLRTISYGEEVPLDPAHDDLAYAKNRRVHFAPTNN